jgi:hypothetical protein
MSRMLRSIKWGAFAGCGLAAFVLPLADADLPLAGEVVEGAPTARPFYGPAHGNAAPIAQSGGIWLGADQHSTLPLKFNFLPPSIVDGTAVTRGGIGSPWGPVHGSTSSAKPSLGPLPDGRWFSTPPVDATAAVDDPRLKRPDSGGRDPTLISAGAPRQWRWDVGY